MKKILTITVALLIFSCQPATAAEGEWFLTGSFEYQIDSRSDSFLQTGCTYYDRMSICHGRNPGSEVKMGYEFAFGDWRSRWYVPIFQVGWKHRSHLFEGAPFNDNPETHTEAIFLAFSLGGLR